MSACKRVHSGSITESSKSRQNQQRQLYTHPPDPATSLSVQRDLLPAARCGEVRSFSFSNGAESFAPAQVESKCSFSRSLRKKTPSFLVSRFSLLQSCNADLHVDRSQLCSFALGFTDAYGCHNDAPKASNHRFAFTKKKKWRPDQQTWPLYRSKEDYPSSNNAFGYTVKHSRSIAENSSCLNGRPPHSFETHSVSQFRFWLPNFVCHAMKVAPVPHAVTGELSHVEKDAIRSGFDPFLVRFRHREVEESFIRHQSNLAGLLAQRSRNRIQIAFVMLFLTHILVALVEASSHTFEVVNGRKLTLVLCGILLLAFFGWLLTKIFEQSNYSRSDRCALQFSAACVVVAPFLARFCSSRCIFDEECSNFASIAAWQTGQILLLSHCLGVIFLARWKTMEQCLLIALSIFIDTIEFFALLPKIRSVQEIFSSVCVLVMSILVVLNCMESGKASRMQWITSTTSLAARERERLVKMFQDSNAFKQKSKAEISVNGCRAGFFRKLKLSSETNHLAIDFFDLETIDFLGKGAMGEVFSAIYLSAPVALKKLSSSLIAGEGGQHFLQEVEILQGLRHPNIVQLMGVTWNEATETAALVLELVSLGSLRAVLANTNMNLSWEDPLAKVSIDIAKGMSFLHRQGIIHRDLKTDNILVSATFTAKISDFGTAMKFEGQCETQIGTPLWRAPEVVRGEPYGLKADVYPFGLVLLDMHTRRDQFENMSQVEIMEFPFKVGRKNFCLPIPEDTPEDLKQLIHMCWNDNPGMRPPFNLISRRLQRFFNEINDMDDLREESKLNKVVMDQIILSGAYEKGVYQDGEFIIRAGEHGDTCFIILNGEVEIFLGPDGAIFDKATFPHGWWLKHIASKGEFFGEMAMLVDQKRTATCRAKGTATLLQFDRETFIAQLDGEIQAMIAQRILKNLQNTKKSMDDAKEGETETEARVRIAVRHSRSNSPNAQILNLCNSGTQRAILKSLGGSKSESSFRVARPLE